MGTIEQIAAKYCAAEQRSLPSEPMAIATATSLDVHVGGKLLFEDVSFKLEPGERMTLSGPQRRRQVDPAAGARRRAARPTPARWRCSAAPGSRCTTSARRANRRLGLGEYVFSGRTDMLEAEAELERLEAEMSAGEARRGDDGRLRRRPGAAWKRAAATAGATRC